MKITQTFSRGDIVKVADYYPWIRQGGKIIAHMTGHGELAVVVGSYKDQYSWGNEADRKVYTLEFEKHGRVSWYDEEYLTLVEKAP